MKTYAQSLCSGPTPDAPSQTLWGDSGIHFSEPAWVLPVYLVSKALALTVQDSVSRT